MDAKPRRRLGGSRPTGPMGHIRRKRGKSDGTPSPNPLLVPPRRALHADRPPEPTIRQKKNRELTSVKAANQRHKAAVK